MRIGLIGRERHAVANVLKQRYGYSVFNADCEKPIVKLPRNAIVTGNTIDIVCRFGEDYKAVGIATDGNPYLLPGVGSPDFVMFNPWHVTGNSADLNSAVDQMLKVLSRKRGIVVTRPASQTRLVKGVVKPATGLWDKSWEHREHPIYTLTGLEKDLRSVSQPRKERSSP